MQLCQDYDAVLFLWGKQHEVLLGTEKSYFQRFKRIVNMLDGLNTGACELHTCCGQTQRGDATLCGVGLFFTLLT